MYAEEIMGLKSFFHKIKTGFARLSGKSIPYISSTKRYGDSGEESFIGKLKTKLPFSRIKRNIIINTLYGNAEIDCLVLYRDKLFAIEVKRWKGHLTETDNGFIKEKTDWWTGEIHSKYQKSPFKQLNRAIYLLRKEISGNVWINSVVYFEDGEFEGIFTDSDNTWFNNINDLVDYIKNDGEITYENNEAKEFFDKCVSSDYLYARSGDNSLHCIITPESLNIQTEQGLVTRKNISHINIIHHFSYDELDITMNDGTHRCAVIENGKITVNDNGKVANYSLCKLDYIEIGR